MFELTVEENISYFCSLYVADRARRTGLVDEAIAFVGLDDYRKRRRLDADALTDVDHALEFVGGAEGDLPAVVNDLDAVADLLDLFHVVARVHDGGTLRVELLDAF